MREAIWEFPEWHHSYVVFEWKKECVGVRARVCVPARVWSRECEWSGISRCSCFANTDFTAKFWSVGLTGPLSQLKLNINQPVTRLCQNLRVYFTHPLVTILHTGVAHIRSGYLAPQQPCRLAVTVCVVFLSVAASRIWASSAWEGEK